MTKHRTYTPALGSARLTPLYDVAIAALTRETVWRQKLVDLVNPVADDRILDVGCGTGTLAIQLKNAAPTAKIIGIDPDPDVLSRARRKSPNVKIDWQHGFLTQDTATNLGPVTKVVSSLVFHQTPVDEKARIMMAMRQILVPGGELWIADYGLQRTRTMRFLFRHTVQMIDGIGDTQPNADGCLSDLISSAGFQNVREIEFIPTITGSISIYRAMAP